MSSEEKISNEVSATKEENKKKNKHNTVLKRAIWFFIAPSGVLFTIFFLIPLVLNIGWSLTDFDGWREMSFIGLDNYRRLFNDAHFWASLRRTVIYAVINLPFRVFIPLLLAVLLTSKRVRFKTFTRTAVYLPVLFSALVVGITINWMFSQHFGLINFVIQSLGGNPVAWASNPWLATFVISVAGTWAGTGFAMIINIGALNNIPEEIYEAAEIDGITPFQKLWRIQIPLLAPTTFLITLLSTMGLLREYALIEGITQGGPGTATTYIIRYIFVRGFNDREHGYAMAVSAIVMLIFAVIAFIQFKWTRGGEIS